MPATYEPIATTTLGSAASTITFSSIGSGYTDLRLILATTLTTSAGDVSIRYNSDTGTNYSWTRLSGNGTTPQTGSSTGTTSNRISFTTSTTQWFFMTVDIFSYSGSTNKTSLSTFSGDYNGSGQVGNYVHLWRNTTAINTIDLILSSGNFATGTTATLYGILKA